MRENFVLDFYGGRSTAEYLGYSNIFFSNGQLDPWSAGSPLESISENLIAFYIAHSAHHLDLRDPNDADPDSVIKGKARLFTYSVILLFLGYNAS